MSRFKSERLPAPPPRRSAAPKPQALTAPVPSRPVPAAPRPWQAPGAPEIGLPKIGFGLTLIFLFGYYGRIFEYLPPDLHPALIIAAAALFAALGCGRLFRGISTPVGICLLVFTATLFLSVPFSVWRANSVDILVNEWLKSLMLFILVTSLACTSRQVITALRVSAVGILTGGLVAWLSGDFVGGRFQSALSGTFSNPNDLAAVMGIGILLWWFCSQHRSPFVAALSLASIAFLGVICARTGSRAVAIALLAAIPFLLAYYTPLGRIRMVIVLVLVGGLVSAFTPGSLQDRFATIFSTNNEPVTPEEYRLQQEAIGSSRARIRLAEEAVSITLANPFLGVGVGNFMVAENDYAKRIGMHAMWHGTHNTYLQISSEAGIPALLFFLAALFGCWRLLGRLKRLSQFHPMHDELRAAAMSLKLMLITLSVGGLFGHFAYSPLLPTTAALIVALYLAASSETRALAPGQSIRQP